MIPQADHDLPSILDSSRQCMMSLADVEIHLSAGAPFGSFAARFAKKASSKEV